MTEAQRLSTLAATSRRRRRVLAAAQALSAGLLVASPVRYLAGAEALAVIVGVIVALMVWFRLEAPVQLIDARAMARHLDEHFPAMADSCELLLPAQMDRSPLQSLQQAQAAETFQKLDASGALTGAVPPLRVARAAGWLVPAVLVCATFALLENDGSTRADNQTAGTLEVIKAQVHLTPLDYTGANASVVNRLDFETLESARVRWTITLSAAARQVSMKFHNGDELTMTAAGERTWASGEWPAFASVYRIIVDGAELPGNIHRVSVIPDKPPAIAVSAPTRTLQLLPEDSRQPVMPLTLSASDDYGLGAANARVTLARGTGEQVRFREKFLPLPVAMAADNRKLRVNTTLDLVQLGMARGDELFVYAEVSDNRPGEANVANTSTYIVRWPADDVLEISQVAAMAVNVLPDYFRSQRQIIIDTEQLLADKDSVDARVFSQRAQDLAIDQKMLRLRYGQFLGEEATSAIGELPDTGESENDAHDGDHAGHEDTWDAPPASGDADAAIALYAHMHDTSEHATLFDPDTRTLLKSALGQMWQSELQLRLAQPNAALPFEYRALELIKQVQQSSRIYLRRAGFQPTPVTEERRLTGELDDIDSLKKTASERDERDSTRLRRLLEALNQPHDSLPGIVQTTAPLIAKLASTNTAWLEALRAVESLTARPDCDDCARALSKALWRQLDPQLATPGGEKALQTPLTQAFEARIQAAR